MRGASDMSSYPATRVHFKSFHEWLLPERVVVAIVSLGLVFVFVGIVLLLIGGALTGWGAAFFAIGLCLCLVCLILCLHSCFVFKISDQETQTDLHDLHVGHVGEKRDSDFIPTYAVIDKKPPPSPSSLKTHKVNGGTYPKKHVTMAPDVQGQPNYDKVVIPVQYQTTRSSPGYGAQNSSFPPYGGQMHHDLQRANQTFPMYSTQPTPYSTLTQKQSYPMQVYPVHRSGFDDDYDNTVEHSPMINQYQSKSAQQTQWRTGSFQTRDEDLPEPQPLQYPSAKRPMTFEQVSSSKMSIYDNVQFGLDKLDE
ncbi:hypothetical protein FSP39_021831 [Pinctada imbricata]|uniref:Uncharacterized protein n=1 Tax=Pinctada imbricata TaxID=66713 RepID=A0AA88XPA3_PINIB|nr:hypothetical protein FSP39_021831 [Pinctada imbricata]